MHEEVESLMSKANDVFFTAFRALAWAEAPAPFTQEVSGSRGR
jgi:hypothetical protein